MRTAQYCKLQTAQRDGALARTKMRRRALAARSAALPSPTGQHEPLPLAAPACRARRPPDRPNGAPPRKGPPPSFSFFGKSSCSDHVPVALRGGCLTPAALEHARRVWADLPDGGFRSTDRVPPRRANGAKFKKLLPAPARDWLEELRSSNVAW